MTALQSADVDARTGVSREAESAGKQALQPLIEAERSRMRASEGWDEEAGWPFFLVGSENLSPAVGLGVATAVWAYALRTARELLCSAREADAAVPQPEAAGAAAAIVGRMLETRRRGRRRRWWRRRRRSGERGRR